MIANHQDKVQFIWNLAELLRGDYKRHEYADVILPLVVLRWLDCVLEPTNEAVLARYEQVQIKVDNVGPILEEVSGHRFYNLSELTFERLLTTRPTSPSTCAANRDGHAHR